MISTIGIFFGALFLVVKGATYATKYASSLAESFRVSRYTIGFIIISTISILPETFISIQSALSGVPSFGLATLFGSNIADLTLIFVIIILYSGRKIKVEGSILKKIRLYPLLMLLPIVLGMDGFFSRIEGVALILAGTVFFYNSFKQTGELPEHTPGVRARFVSGFLLIVSMAMLLVGSHFTVTSAVTLASYVGVSPVLIGMLIVSLGTTLPELFFALKSVRKHDDALGVGDILGTVLADATIVVGILAVLRPFAFPLTIIYVTGAYMVLASIILIYCMKTGRTISRKEALLLLSIWISFVITEYMVSSMTRS